MIDPKRQSHTSYRVTDVHLLPPQKLGTKLVSEIHPQIMEPEHYVVKTAGGGLHHFFTREREVFEISGFSTILSVYQSEAEVLSAM